MINFATRGLACLDNIFTNIDHADIGTEPFDLGHLSDHTGIIFSYNFLSAHTTHQTRFNYRPVTDEGLFLLYNTIEVMKWDFIDNTDIPLDDRFRTFIDIIAGAAEDCFPLKSRVVVDHRQKFERVNWFTNELREMRERLHTLYFIAKDHSHLVTK